MFAILQVEKEFLRANNIIYVITIFIIFMIYIIYISVKKIY